MNASTSFSRLTSFLRLASRVGLRSSARMLHLLFSRSIASSIVAERLGADRGREAVVAELVLRLEVFVPRTGAGGSLSGVRPGSITT